MVRWPTMAKTRTATLMTILVSQDVSVKCSAHADGSTVVISDTWNAGVPGANGNGHPLDATATKWERCSTCERLVLYVPGYRQSAGYGPVCERRDFSGTDYFEDTYLNEVSPTTNYFSTDPLRIGGAGESECVSLFSIFNLQGLGKRLHSKARIIKAEFHLYNTTMVFGTAVSDFHRILRSGVAEAQLDEATWNIYKTGSNWATAGAYGNGTDRDAGVIDSVSVSAVGDYIAIQDGAGFRTLIEDYARTSRLIIGGYKQPGENTPWLPGSTENAVQEQHPFLRLWYETVLPSRSRTKRYFSPYPLANKETS